MIAWTRVRLTRWGQWCRQSTHLGYPRSAAFTHANQGGRASSDGSEMPNDVQEIEDCIKRMSYALRQPIMIVYVKPGPLWLKAYRMGISRRTLKRRLLTAEEWIDRQLMA
jgi:hypothetical protein